MIKAVLFGYRDWAFEVFNELKANKNTTIILTFFLKKIKSRK